MYPGIMYPGHKSRCHDNENDHDLATNLFKEIRNANTPKQFGLFLALLWHNRTEIEDFVSNGSAFCAK